MFSLVKTTLNIAGIIGVPVSVVLSAQTAAKDHSVKTKLSVRMELHAG